MSGLSISGYNISFSNGDVIEIPSTDKGQILKVDRYTSSGTWTKPPNATKVLVQVSGGGGGGASYCESGGGGGYSEKVIDVTSVSSVAVTVGAGGANVGYYAAGGDGGTSSFGSYCSATGGYGCNRNSSHTGGHGGVGSGGDINLYGGVGTGHSNGANRGALGQGGFTYWGDGRKTSHYSDYGAVGHGAPGSGGPGGATDIQWSGGAGLAGIVIVYSYR